MKPRGRRRPRPLHWPRCTLSLHGEGAPPRTHRNQQAGLGATGHWTASRVTLRVWPARLRPTRGWPLVACDCGRPCQTGLCPHQRPGRARRTRVWAGALGGQIQVRPGQTQGQCDLRTQGALGGRGVHLVTPKQGSQRAHRGQGCLRKGESFRGPFTRWEGADGPEEMGKLRQGRAVTV